ncbi:MAG: response regulator [Rhodomicrobium sp.]
MNLGNELPLKGARILVAEDDAIQAFGLMTLLQAAGADVLGPARTPAQALALAAAQALTCAVLDVNLRSETSFPAARLLQERRIGIVFYTGYDGLDALRRDWPGAQVLSKPASPELLLQAVRAACCSNCIFALQSLLSSLIGAMAIPLFSAMRQAAKFLPVSTAGKPETAERA